MPRSSTTFKKGQSGNPKGRPQELAHVKALAAQYTEVAIEALAAICQNLEERGSARVAAAEAILNRAWGRPEQAVELSGKDGSDLIPHITVTIHNPVESES